MKIESELFAAQVYRHMRSLSQLCESFGYEGSPNLIMVHPEADGIFMLGQSDSDEIIAAIKVMQLRTTQTVYDRSIDDGDPAVRFLDEQDHDILENEQ